MWIFELQVVLLPEVLGYSTLYSLPILQLQREPAERRVFVKSNANVN